MKDSVRHNLVFPRIDEKRQTSPLLLWSAIVVLFLIVHFPHDVVLLFIRALLDVIRGSDSLHSFLTVVSGKYARSDREALLSLITQSVIVPLKTVAFIFVFVVLSRVILASSKNARWIWGDGKFLRRCLDTLWVFACLALLVFPRFLQSLGDEYGRMSLSPFTEGYGIYYRRVLMPALAHTLGTSGYVFYFFFSLLCTFLLVFLVRLWIESKGLPRSNLFLLSVMTSSFVIYNFQMPGYPEQISFALILITSLVPMGVQARAAVIALALATHEGTAFALAPLVWFLFPQEQRRSAFLVFVVYGGILITSHLVTDFRFLPTVLFRDESGRTAPQYFSLYPLRALLGIFFAYKLLWFPIMAAFIVTLREGQTRTSAAIASLIGIPILMLPIALDSSRLAGFGFMGLLVSLFISHANGLLALSRARLLMIVNLLIPPCYVGLNSGVQLLPGAYSIYRILARAFGE